MATPDAVTTQTIELEPVHDRHLTAEVLSGGTGSPLVVLHRDTGLLGWTDFHAKLAEQYHVFAPSIPGFPGSSLPEWARSTTDVAALTGHLLDLLDIGPVPVVGLGFGGWVAAEIAAMCSHRISALVLQAPMGIQPPEGEILDQILVSAEDYVRLGFSSDEAFQKFFGAEPDEATREIWEIAREMTVRVAWKPYMFSQTLPRLLRMVDLPTKVIFGANDRIVPFSCGDAYHHAIKGAEVAKLDVGGHQLDLECPSELAAAIAAFLQSH